MADCALSGQEEEAMAKRRAPERRSRAYEAGMRMRRRWMGKDYVERAFRESDGFSIDLQHYVTEHGWGATWGRGGLPLKIRSIMSLSMLLALNRPRELEIHLRAALRNGITRAEIKELLLHGAVYCGVPATLDGFHVAKRILAEKAKAG
jgi:4-carboxymuconolactone decarboxylase